MFDAITGSPSDLEANMAALVVYFNRTEPHTPAAAKVKNDFAGWNSNLGWWAMNMDSNVTWNQARNFKLQFDRANAITPAQQALVEQVAATGMTSEQMQGLPDQAKTSTGLYAAPSTKPPLIPAEYKWAVAVVVVGGVLIFSYGLSASLPAAVAAWAAGKGFKKEEKKTV
jgi:hypothetical protein